MPGCDFQNKSFSVAVTDIKEKMFCDVCGFAIGDTLYKARGKRMCRSCFISYTPDKEIGLPMIDAFPEVHDKDLGASYTSIREKQRLMKKKGVSYADDWKQNREIGKEAKFNLGSQGNRKLREIWI